MENTTLHDSTLTQLAESDSPPCHRYFPPTASPSTYKTAFVTGQSWQCTSLCQACFPSLFFGGRLGATDCRRDIEIHFTFPPSLAIANALKCSSVWHREKSLFFQCFLIYLTPELWWEETRVAGAFWTHWRQFIEDHGAHYSETPELPFTMHTSNASLYKCK